MNLKNVFSNIFKKGVDPTQIPAEVWNYLWTNSNVRKVRFPAESYDAVRVNDEYMLVRVPKKEKATNPETSESTAFWDR